MTSHSLLAYTALFVLAFCGLSAEASHPFTVCDTVPITPTSVTLIPNPPKFGHTLTVVLDMKPNRHIHGGTFEYKVFYRLNTFGYKRWVEADKGTEDICLYAKCPIWKKPITITYHKKLPSGGSFFVRGGSFKLRITAKDLNENKLFCVEMLTKINSAATVSDIIFEEGKHNEAAVSKRKILAIE